MRGISGEERGKSGGRGTDRGSMKCKKGGAQVMLMPGSYSSPEQTHFEYGMVREIPASDEL